MSKNSLRDKIEENELDLSLSNLEIVPVKELKELRKATHLDLSCNLIATLPRDFPSLDHLVRLDLSKNRLKSLPTNFGDLVKLQCLDLFQNELATLPVSMCRLDKLRWLDVKDNPIHQTLKSVAGDCLNEAQCKACAKNIVAFMKKADAQQEKERQTKLQAERELERKRRAAEEEERARQLKEKELKRREHEARVRQERERQLEQQDEDQDQGGQGDVSVEGRVETETSKGGLSCCGLLVTMLVGLLAVCAGLYVYCSRETGAKDQFCRQTSAAAQDLVRRSQPYLRDISATISGLVDKGHGLLLHLLAKGQEILDSYSKK